MASPASSLRLFALVGNQVYELVPNDKKTTAQEEPRNAKASLSEKYIHQQAERLYGYNEQLRTLERQFRNAKTHDELNRTTFAFEELACKIEELDVAGNILKKNFAESRKAIDYIRCQKFRELQAQEKRLADID